MVKTLEERVGDLERMPPAQIRALKCLNDQETASVKADIATLRAQMLAGFASVEKSLNRHEGGFDKVEQELGAIRQTLDALPRVLAEEIAKQR